MENNSVMICCKCGKEADVQDDPHAWDGWGGEYTSEGFVHICPDCIAHESMDEAAARC